MRRLATASAIDQGRHQDRRWRSTTGAGRGRPGFSRRPGVPSFVWARNASLAEIGRLRRRILGSTPTTRHRKALPAEDRNQFARCKGLPPTRCGKVRTCENLSRVASRSLRADPRQNLSGANSGSYRVGGRGGRGTEPAACGDLDSSKSQHVVCAVQLDRGGPAWTRKSS